MGWQDQLANLDSSGGCCHTSQFTQNTVLGIELKWRMFANVGGQLCEFCKFPD
jgi:hypothetical protein